MNVLRCTVAFLVACGGSETSTETPSERPSEPVAESSSLYLIDLLVLQEGSSVSRAEEYFSRIEDVTERHGLRSVRRYVVQRTLAGQVQPQIVNIWSMESPQTLPAIQSDPDYQAHVEFRNGTFNMPAITMFTAESTVPLDRTNAPLLFLDLLDLQPGVEESQASEYFSRIGPVVERHGLVPVGRFRVRQRLAGELEAELVNLWTMEGAHTMPGIQQDPAYQENVSFRNATFVMPTAVMMTLTPAGS